MANALIINSSALGEASVSNKLTREFADSLKAADPSLEIKLRDVGKEPVPHLTAETVGAIRGDAETAEARETLALSEVLIEELEEADLLVIGSPMYNLGISSTLKTWFDHVVRAGVTFRYTAEGKSEGLMTGKKKAVVIESRAGFYSEGPASGMDSQEPHLRNLLGFIGITDVTFVRAEKLAFGPEAAAAAVEAAAAEFQALSRKELALAA
ncbi:MAG TPA: FMN-dependent NADH-azoreductase [Allosphingosinicella sp.]|nr:FMN-dependent NADH-azoreductase [Allosphingosinicella sp.]